ncbi:MAG: hypothetical protein U5R49_12625 [Deltaproteobacteria bacterium]|nr:hypothetical protein [Deltaproteobacteria bacterium]
MTRGTPDSNLPVVRLRVDRLLTEASDLKMMRHHTREARRKIEKAYKLSKDNELDEPWPSLCAYRLAHLIMRTASDTESLLDAEQYFMEAARATSLGPLPALYRLAALHRLRKLSADVDKAHIRNAISKAEEAIRESSVDKRTQIQDHLFNLLELTSYFSGIDYTEVEGMGEYPNGRKPAHSWILVGPEPQMAEVRYSEPYAMEELAAIEEGHPNAVFFILWSLTSAKRHNVPKAQWKTAQEKWKKASYPVLKLLALLLRQTSKSLDHLRYEFLGSSDFTSDAFNQNKLRLKKHLAQLTNMGVSNILVETGQDVPRINPHIEIYGALEESALYFQYELE